MIQAVLLERKRLKNTFSLMVKLFWGPGELNVVKHTFGPTGQKGINAMPSYSDAQRNRMASAVSLRIYGVQLEEASTLEGYTCILYCGLSAGGEEQRKCSNRIWHLPKDKIFRAGEVEDFTCKGQKVYWFEVPKDISLTEEKYVGVSLGSEMKQLSMPTSSSTEEGINVFAAHIAEPVAANLYGLEVAPAVAQLRGRRRSDTVPGNRKGFLFCDLLEELGVGNCRGTHNAFGGDDTTITIYEDRV
jgi:hypothetical protein